MDVSKLTENQVSFWQVDLFPRVHDAYSFAFLLTGGKNPASICTIDAFEKMLENIESLRTSPDFFPEVGKFVWLSFQDLTSRKKLPDPEQKNEILTLTPNERCALAMMDLLGLGIHTTAQAIGWSESETYSQIAHARKKLLDLHL